MLDKLKNFIKTKTFKHTDYSVKSNDSLKLFWWNKKYNFGDTINYELALNISNKEVEWVPSNYNKEYFMAIGSILHRSNSKTLVWGSGLISKSSYPIEKPKEIFAVRGPLTRERLLNLGIKCPDVYGDPALLFPIYFNPKIEKRYELGIIPHYIDKNHNFFKNKFTSDVNIIDIENKNPYNFIKEVLQCKKIISSSLHGLIIADAYDIPSIHVNFSNNIKGGNFKFNDYFLSVKREVSDPIYITNKTSIKDIFKINFSYTKKINHNRLLEVCPFKQNINEFF